MAYDYRKLTGRIIEKFGSRAAFAEAANTSPRTISKKLNNAAKLTQDDIVLWGNLLEIPDDEVRVYFFTQSSQVN